MARWRSMWWVSRLARSAVVGFSIVLVSKIDSFFVFFFFFSSWWLCGGCFLWMWLLLVVFEVFFVSFFFFVVALSCGCGWWLVGGLSCGFAQIGDGLVSKWWVWWFFLVGFQWYLAVCVFFSLVFIFLVVLVVAVPCVCCCWWVCSDVSGSGGVWVLKIFFYGVF